MEPLVADHCPDARSAPLWLAPARRLAGQDRAAVVAHLLRLSPEDRRMRFLRAMTDASIAAYADRLDLDEAACFGFLDAKGAVVALGEALPLGLDGVEAAFSTDAGWRSVGLARALFAAMTPWAAGVGRTRIVLHCDARNRAMRALLRSVEATVEVAGGEVDAVCTV